MTYVNWKGPALSTTVLVIGVLTGVLLTEKSLDWWFLAIAATLAALAWAMRKSIALVSRHLLSFLVQLFATLVGGLVSAVATATFLGTPVLRPDGVGTEHLTLERGLVFAMGLALYFGAQVIDRVVAPPIEEQ